MTVVGFLLIKTTLPRLKDLKTKGSSLRFKSLKGSKLNGTSGMSFRSLSLNSWKHVVNRVTLLSNLWKKFNRGINFPSHFLICPVLIMIFSFYQLEMQQIGRVSSRRPNSTTDDASPIIRRRILDV